MEEIDVLAKPNHMFFSVSSVKFYFFTILRVLFVNSIPFGNSLTITLSLLLVSSLDVLLPTFLLWHMSHSIFSTFNSTKTLLASKYLTDEAKISKNIYLTLLHVYPTLVKQLYQLFWTILYWMKTLLNCCDDIYDLQTSFQNIDASLYSLKCIHHW